VDLTAHSLATILMDLYKLTSNHCEVLCLKHLNIANICVICTFADKHGQPDIYCWTVLHVSEMASSLKANIPSTS
jgi:hypothetical protein